MEKRGAKKLIYGDAGKGSTCYWNYIEDNWPCAGGLSVMNPIGTQLRDSINSCLARWRWLTVKMDTVVAESGRNSASKADSYAYEKLIRKWTKSICFFRDQKHERRPSYAYGFGLLYFRQTRTGLPMLVRYSNKIAEWKWPQIFQNKTVRYARKK